MGIMGMGGNGNRNSPSRTSLHHSVVGVVGSIPANAVCFTVDS